MGNPIARSELCDEIRDRLFEAGKHYTDAKFSRETADSLAAWVMDVIPPRAWENEIDPIEEAEHRRHETYSEE